MFNASSSRLLVSVMRRQASVSSVPFALCVPLWPLFFSFVSLSATAAAQTTDTIGVRAQGMAGAFTAVADLAPYTHEPSRIDLMAKNTKLSYGADRSEKMDFSDYDLVDDWEMNEILWRAVKGPDAGD